MGKDSVNAPRITGDLRRPLIRRMHTIPRTPGHPSRDLHRQVKVAVVRRRTAMLVLVSAVVPVALAATTATSHVNLAAVNHGRFISAVKGQVLPTRNDTTSSLNWSGYATAPGSGITAVNSTFRVPSVSAVPPGFAANWTGIGGYTSQDLIQAGTSEDELQGYYAWYEILPASETQLTNCTGDSACTVNPGDTVSVDIH